VIAGIESRSAFILECYYEPLRRGLRLRGRVVYAFRSRGRGSLTVAVHQQDPVEGPDALVLRAVAHCVGRELARIPISPSIPATAEPVFYPFVWTL
jgi:hypothetical protein